MVVEKKQDYGKRTTRDDWEEQAPTWDETISSESSPHFHYYRTADFYIHEMVKESRLALELGCGT